MSNFSDTELNEYHGVLGLIPTAREVKLTESFLKNLCTKQKSCHTPEEEPSEPWSIEWQAFFCSFFLAACLHTIVALSAVWSVKIKSKLSSNRLQNSKTNLPKATHILVEPTANNGESESVTLSWDRVNKLYFFVFQKIKYV